MQMTMKGLGELLLSRMLWSPILETVWTQMTKTGLGELIHHVVSL